MKKIQKRKTTKQNHQSSIYAPRGRQDGYEDETPRGGYKEALLSAAGKRERTKAHTGMTPPAKAASPGRKDDTPHREEKNPKNMLEDLSMEEEILPQWSADEDDEALLKEASERGTTQHEEPKESASGAKRSLELHTDPSGQPKDRREKTKRRRDEARIYPVFLAPRDPNLVLGKHLPLHAVALLTEWSTDLKVITRGAEATAIRNVFKVGLNEEELALQFRLVYSERTNKSINIIHKDKKGVETTIPYICTKELIPDTQGAKWKREDHG